MNASHLTVRNLPAELAVALEKEKHRRGTSLNQTVIDLLQISLGITGSPSNGIARFAGTWTERDHQEFLSAIQGFEEIDQEFFK